VPAGFDNVFAGRAFVGFSPFDPAMHVSLSRQMVVHKFDEKDLGTVLWSFKCLLRDVPIDGSKRAERPGVPGHESLACSGAASCLPELFCTSLSDSFALIVRLA
jgi:hypothetical protein